MIENEIAKAVKKHEEERKKQEVKECKRQEREIEHLRKQQEIEDKKRLEELEKLGNKETNVNVYNYIIKYVLTFYYFITFNSYF